MCALKRATSQPETPFRDQLNRLGVVKQFDCLVSGGCDPDALRDYLLLLCSAKTANTWEKLMGVGPRELKTVRQRLLTCAQDLERLSKSYYGLLQLAGMCSRDPEVAEFWPDLPDLLQEFAFNLGLDRIQLRRLRPRSRLASNYAIALLVRYVIQATKSPRDPEVAALIAAFEWRPNYTADAHKVWRYAHDAQLKADKPFILDFLLPSR